MEILGELQLAFVCFLVGQGEYFGEKIIKIKINKKMYFDELTWNKFGFCLNIDDISLISIISKKHHFFNLFFVVYDAFEHWKSLVKVLCTCDEAVCKYPKLFDALIGKKN